MGAPDILLVDDDDDLRESLGEILEAEGYGVLEAENGRVALEILQTFTKPSVILVDFMMPVMDGAQFYRARSNDPAFASIPVIVLSAHCSPAEARTLFPGATFLSKPIDLDRLFEEVRR